MIFRYPGGKTRLVPVLFPIIEQFVSDGDEFHDVFVGGGSILIHAARALPNSRLFANDKDPWMCAFWRTLVGKAADFDGLVRLVGRPPTIAAFNKLRATEPGTSVERAYYSIFFNRTTFSGMSGSGPIGGYGQTSKWTVGCRYNADRLCSELAEWRKLLKGRLSVSDVDGAEYVGRTREFMYLDPPYYKQGPALYHSSMSPDDHARLAAVLKSRGRWVLSYDNCVEVRRLYAWASTMEIPARYSIRGKKDDWRDDAELVVTPTAVAYPWQERLL